MTEEKKIWKFCPGCGRELPLVENLKFCINCGLDLLHVQENKSLPATTSPAYTTNNMKPQYYPSQPVLVKAPPKKYQWIEDEDIINTDEPLYGTGTSLGFPLLAFIAMNAMVIMIILLIFVINPNAISNPTLIAFLTLFEFILIAFPLIWTRRYLKNPSLKNRLALLGFTTKGYDEKRILKEVGIGLGFALIGLGVVVGATLAMTFILELFGVQFVEPSETEANITVGDIFALIVMILMMILVVGPCEEILFRGFMMKGLTRTLGKNLSLFLTAFIFAIIHLVVVFVYIIIDPVLFVILFVYLFAPYIAISIMLGLLFNWRGENLIACVVCHGVYNSIVVTISFLFMVLY